MRIPVILDTDIGDDIDDSWALAMLLKSPELDIRLVTTEFGDTRYRAALACRFLETAGRTDVPVGIGIRQEDSGDKGRQYAWVRDYPLPRYPGRVHEDGVQAMIDTIMASAAPITLICIGPLPNVAEALRREPRIAARTRFVGMHGSVYKGYEGAATPHAEWNVKADPVSARAVFSAAWREMVITPLDTCGLVRLRGEDYARVCACRDPLTQALVENYRIWLTAFNRPEAGHETESSILFDTVAVHLAYTTRWLRMESLGIRVTDDGFTVPDAQSRIVNAAVEWSERTAFEKDLVQRLYAPAVRRA